MNPEGEPGTIYAVEAGHTEIGALDLIDCLASAGLTLVRDGGGQASGAYFGSLTDEESP